MLGLNGAVASLYTLAAKVYCAVFLEHLSIPADQRIGFSHSNIQYG